MDELQVSTLVAGAAFVAGLVFGATAQRTNFCTMGAISDIVFIGDWRRFRAWLLAIAVALIATQALHAAGVIDIYESIYLTPNLGWLGAIVGGALFGFGMTLTGGCGNKILVRIGAGNLKSLVAAVALGLFAAMTLRGLFADLRLDFESLTTVDLAARGVAAQGIGDLIGAASGFDAGALRGLLAAIVGLGFLWFCFKDAAFRASPRDMAAGLIIGLLIPAGWLITGVLGFDDFDPTRLASFTFVAPMGDAIQYLMTFSGATINFGIAAVGGVIAGAFLMAVATRQFHVETFNERADLVRHLAGGAVMGVGGVLALGCTIGQGITGMSTLAFGSLLAWLSIIAGAVYGMKYLEEDSFRGALRALFARS